MAYGGGYGGNDSDERMRRELEGIQQQADRTTNQSLEATRRMVAMTEQTQEVGIKTLEELDHQGEQIDRIEDNLDQINADMKRAERNLTQMEKCCGLCVCPWNRSRNYESSSTYKRAWGSDAVKAEDDVVKRQPRTGDFQATGSARGGGQQQGGFIQRVTDDAREDEMDENLGQVSRALGNLKNMAVDMGNELERQNVQLDRVNAKAEANDERVQAANVRTKKILRNA